MEGSILETVQQVLFLNEAPKLSALEFWELAFAGKPTGFQTGPNGFSQAQGPGSGVDHVIQVRLAPDRIDLLSQGQIVDAPPPVIKDVDAVIATGLDAIGKFVDRIDVGRAATVLQGHLQVDGPAAGVVRLGEFFHGITLPPSSEDVALQLAIPTTSPSRPKRQFKQLCQCQLFQMQFFQVGAPAGFSMQPMQSTPHIWAIRANIDVFGVRMAELESADVLTELAEVGAIAKRIFAEGIG
jgi:hypothetical protein